MSQESDTQDIIGTQPWHLSIFGERAEDKGLDMNQQPPHGKWGAFTSLAIGAHSLQEQFAKISTMFWM
jgi:hypothetical protein